LCGRSFDAHEWAALPLVGHQPAEDPDYLIELRNCQCTSTISIDVPGPGFWLWMCSERIVEAREEAQRSLPSLSRAYAERARVSLTQALELLKMLADQRAAKAQAAE
jgi:hypothetical protein